MYQSSQGGNPPGGQGIVNSSSGNEDNRENTSKLMGFPILGACGCAISPVLNGSARGSASQGG